MFMLMFVQMDQTAARDGFLEMRASNSSVAPHTSAMELSTAVDYAVLSQGSLILDLASLSYK